MRIAFLHGLESPAKSKKQQYLKDNSDFLYSPAIDYRDPTAYSKVLTKIQSLNIDLIVGSSMGGWFAYAISTLTGIPTILLNPALQGRVFDPDGVKLGTKSAKHLVVLGKADKVIDPNETKAWIKKNGIGSFDITMESIGHRSPVFVLSKQYSKLNETKTFKTFEKFIIEMKDLTTYNDFLNEKNSYPDNIKKWIKQTATPKQKSSAAKVIKWAGYIGGGTTVGKSPQGLILDITYQGGEIAIQSNGEISIMGEVIKDEAAFNKMKAEVKKSKQG